MIAGLISMRSSIEGVILSFLVVSFLKDILDQLIAINCLIFTSLVLCDEAEGNIEQAFLFNHLNGRHLEYLDEVS